LTGVLQSYSSSCHTNSIILSSIKIQNGDVLVLAYLGCPGKWPLTECGHCCTFDIGDYRRILSSLLSVCVCACVNDNPKVVVVDGFGVKFSDQLSQGCGQKDIE